MSKLADSYYRLIASVTLFLYLACTFQPVMLEALHFVNHLGDIESHAYSAHHSDHGSDHDHHFLEFLEISFNHSPDQHSDKDKEKVVNLKKLYETIQDNQQEILHTVFLSDHFGIIPDLYRSPLLNISLPPPKA